ncbi:MAG: pirin family protein [Lachnospiraceae bacterium]
MSSVIKKSGTTGFQMEVSSPYIVTAHHRDHFPRGNSNMEPVEYVAGRRIGNDFDINEPWRMYYGDKISGFPVHPHRGFETVTIVTKGLVDHADGSGAGGRYGFGDVQWMTAGSGMQHSEMFPLEFQDKDNPFELFQIWLNLPAAKKFVDPYYKMIWNEEIPTVTTIAENGNKAAVRILNGTYHEHKFIHANPDSWAADPYNHVNILLIRLEQGTSVTLHSVPHDVTRTIYFYEGKTLSVDETEVHVETYHVLDGTQNVTLTNNSVSVAHILLLDGRPIDEPIMAYGPFVMNTYEEIERAYSDYHATQFGGWPWKDDGPVYDRSEGRFAKYADGTVIKPPVLE